VIDDSVPDEDDACQKFNTQEAYSKKAGLQQRQFHPPGQTQNRAQMSDSIIKNTQKERFVTSPGGRGTRLRGQIKRRNARELKLGAVQGVGDTKE